MRKYNRIIYYCKDTGIVLYNTGEPIVSGVESYEEIRANLDYKNIQALSERNKDSIGEIHLELGQYTVDFDSSIGCRVNPDTLELEFIYPDPNGEEPEEPLYQPSLSEQVLSLESDLGNLLLENAADKATIATLEDTVGNLLLEVAALKGGAE